jgi:hypothetical protein
MKLILETPISFLKARLDPIIPSVKKSSPCWPPTDFCQFYVLSILETPQDDRNALALMLSDLVTNCTFQRGEKYRILGDTALLRASFFPERDQDLDYVKGMGRAAYSASASLYRKSPLGPTLNELSLSFGEWADTLSLLKQEMVL